MKDLFENWDLIPINVQNVLLRFNDAEEYEDLQKAKQSIERLGYTFDFGLDCVPYNLRAN